MGTKSQSTIESVQALDEDIDNLAKQPITDEEIKQAKDAILNAFIFRLDSPDKVLAERMIYEFYGYPADWLDKYPIEVQKVTAEDVNRVAREIFAPRSAGRIDRRQHQGIRQAAIVAGNGEGNQYQHSSAPRREGSRKRQADRIE